LKVDANTMLAITNSFLKLIKPTLRNNLKVGLDN
jgi:hypothetical protein